MGRYATVKACLDPQGNALANGAVVKWGEPITCSEDFYDYRNTLDYAKPEKKELLPEHS